MGMLKKRAPENVEHHKALPADRAPGFMAKLAKKESISGNALQFLVLTAGPIRAGAWGDLGRTIPRRGPVDRPEGAHEEEA